jgi:hypothetical protein
MSDKNSITQELVKSFFDYKDGQLIWKNTFNKKRSANGVAGKPRPDGYVVAWFLGKATKVHRLVFIWHHGYAPKIIDHINRNRADNRIENLREATPSENSFNQTIQLRNKIGVRGIYLQPSKKWRAMIQYKSKLYCLGQYENIDDAIAARKKAEEKLFGNFA